MSVFDFLATDDRDFPRLYSPKKHDSSGKPIFRFQSEEDLNELELLPVLREETYGDVPYYTHLPYIFEVDWQFSMKRCRRMITHLQTYMKPGRQYEFWHIWLANARSNYTYRDGISRGLECLMKEGVNIMEADEENIRKLYMEHEYLRIHFYRIPGRGRKGNFKGKF